MRRRHVLHLLVFIFAGVNTLTASAAPRRIEIIAQRFAFAPDSITLKEGEPVLLVLNSVDVKHGLRIRQLGLNLTAAKGKPAEILLTPSQAGDFIGHCSVFCGAKHGSMTITFHVVK